MAPTFDIPFGRSKTSAKRTSPAIAVVSKTLQLPLEVQRTLSHEVFEVMPFDVVSQITHVDTTVLLRGFAHRLHHLFFCGGTFFE